MGDVKYACVSFCFNMGMWSTRVCAEELSECISAVPTVSSDAETFRLDMHSVKDPNTGGVK